jgi:hypothetical protein
LASQVLAYHDLVDQELEANQAGPASFLQRSVKKVSTRRIVVEATVLHIKD